MKAIALLACFVVTACSSVQPVASDGTAVTAGLNDAVTKLKKVEIYAFGGVGFAGTLSEGEKLYSAIILRDRAKSDLLDVASEGTIERDLG